MGKIGSKTYSSYFACCSHVCPFNFCSNVSDQLIPASTPSCLAMPKLHISAIHRFRVAPHQPILVAIRTARRRGWPTRLASPVVTDRSISKSVWSATLWSLFGHSSNRDWGWGFAIAQLQIILHGTQRSKFKSWDLKVGQALKRGRIGRLFSSYFLCFPFASWRLST